MDDGRIRTTLTDTLSPINAENLKKAHALIESGTISGKIAKAVFEEMLEGGLSMRSPSARQLFAQLGVGGTTSSSAGGLDACPFWGLA